MATQGSKWSTRADLTEARATTEAKAKTDVPGDNVLNTHVGHFCYFEQLNDTTKHVTEPFDFPVISDLTVVLNGTGVDLDAGVTVDVTMEGSIGGGADKSQWTWTELASKTALIQDSTGTIDETARACVYDYDTYGRMPHMRLAIQGNTGSDSTFYISVIPQ